MDPVKGQFFGRERLIREVVEGVLAPQPSSFSLVGSKLLGKSKILKYLASEEGPLLNEELADWRPLRFQDAGRIVAANVDCDWQDAQQDVLLSIYEHLAQQLREKERIDLDWGQIEAQSSVSRQIWQIARQLNQMDYRLVILLDNFDAVFERQLISLDSVDELRPLTIELALVVATEQPLHDLDRDLAASPLFNVMTQVFVGLVEPEATCHWIEAYAEEYPTVREMVDDLVTVTGGHPYLLHRIGDILPEVQHMLPPGQEISPEFFPVIRLRLAEHGRLLFERLWRNLQQPPQRIHPKVVMDLAQQWLTGPLAVSQITREQFSVLNWLINMAMVTYGTDGYQLFSPLFSEFLANRMTLEQNEDTAVEQTISTAPTPASTQHPTPTPPVAPQPINTNAEIYSRLTKKEAALLRYFQTHSYTVISPQQLLADVWRRPDASPRRVQEAIRRLRLRLEDESPSIGVIENDRGRGYRFMPADGA